MKKQDEAYQKVAAYKNQRKEKLAEVITSTKNTIGELEILSAQLQKYGDKSTDSLTQKILKSAIPLILQPKFEKARLNSFELLAHLKGKSIETKKSKDHFNRIIRNSEALDQQLAKINTGIPLD
ncbi:MAG: hypothetical protein U0Z17_09745 [Bacteroidales bacterium]